MSQTNTTTELQTVSQTINETPTQNITCNAEDDFDIILMMDADPVSDRDALIDNAVTCLKSGLSIVPVGRNKQPAADTWIDYKSQAMTIDAAKRTFSQRHVLGFGIIGGPVSGNLEMIDIDDADIADTYIDQVKDTYWGSHYLSTVPIVRTPKGGLHIYYRHSMKTIGNRKLAVDNDKQTLIETRGDGGYVVAPFSSAACHPLKKSYELIQGDLFDIPVIDNDARRMLWVIAKSFTRLVDKKDIVSPPKSKGSASGNRPGDDFNSRADWDDVLRPAGWNPYRQVGITTQWTRPGKGIGCSATTNLNGSDLLYVFSSNASPLDSERWYTKFSAYTMLYHNGDFSKAARALALKGYGDLPDYRNDDHHLTDTGNASRFVSQHGNNVRYARGDGDAGQWYVWDGSRWMRDNQGDVYRKAKETALTIYSEVSNTTDDDKRKALRQHAARSESKRSIESMLFLARSELPVATTTDRLDRDKWLFNVQNGTIDLRTGQFRSANRDDYITRLAPVTYDPDAKCPRWEQFMMEVMDNNPDLVAYLQRILGLCLTGDIREHILPVFYGNGRNGKNTMLDTVIGLMGNDYADYASDSLLTQKSANNHPTEKADLWGKRLMVANESDEGSRLKVSQVKNLTGDAYIKARFMRQDFFTFERTHKMIMATNHKPVISDTSDAIWYRVKLIPFNRQFIGNAADTSLADTLKNEFSGILNWMITGCMEWLQHGLQEPPVVTIATNEYRADEDILSTFLEDCCIQSNEYRVSRKDIRLAYSDWAKHNGQRDVKPSILYDRLQKHGFQQIAYKTAGKTLRGFQGLTIDESKITDALKNDPGDD